MRRRSDSNASAFGARFASSRAISVISLRRFAAGILETRRAFSLARSLLATPSRVESLWVFRGLFAMSLTAVAFFFILAIGLSLQRGQTAAAGWTRLRRGSFPPAPEMSP